MQEKDKIRIGHIISAAEEAIDMLGDKSLDEFENNRMLVLSLIKEIEIIGEAAAKISKQTKAEYSRISWEDIVGMRNYLIHVDLDVDYKMIWDTVKYDLPPLLEEAKRSMLKIRNITLILIALVFAFTIWIFFLFSDRERKYKRKHFLRTK